MSSPMSWSRHLGALSKSQRDANSSTENSTNAGPLLIAWVIVHPPSSGNGLRSSQASAAHTSALNLCSGSAPISSTNTVVAILCVSWKKTIMSISLTFYQVCVSTVGLMTNFMLISFSLIAKTGNLESATYFQPLKETLQFSSTY